MNERIAITTSDGSSSAYLARPQKANAPAVVVLHEVFGVNADIRETCDTLASNGFLAIAPDLFWRQEPGVDLKVDSEADWNHGLELYAAFDRAKSLIDIIAGPGFHSDGHQCERRAAAACHSPAEQRHQRPRLRR